LPRICELRGSEFFRIPLPDFRFSAAAAIDDIEGRIRVTYSAITSLLNALLSEKDASYLKLRSKNGSSEKRLQTMRRNVCGKETESP
jgi:hypothetical protein